MALFGKDSTCAYKINSATTNRGALGIAKERNPDVNWEYARWVVDKKEGGELWTAGGAQAGESIGRQTLNVSWAIH